MTAPEQLTPRGWLAERSPEPPPALAARLLEALGARATMPTAEVGLVLLEAGESLLSRLLVEGRTDRESALDLLAADAFVTYAFEAACDDPAHISERARHAMARISRLSVAVEP